MLPEPSCRRDALAQGGGGADIINMSLGAVIAKSDEGGGQLVAAMNKAVNFANRFGVLVVSAAGNDGIDLDHSGNLIAVPAQSGSGVSVSATAPMGFALGATDFERPASYTNYGTSAINVAAPGGDTALPGTAVCSLARVPTGSVVFPCWVFDMVVSTSQGAAASTTSYSGRRVRRWSHRRLRPWPRSSSRGTRTFRLAR